MEIIFATINEDAESHIVYADDFFKTKDGYVYSAENFRAARDCIRDVFQLNRGMNIILHSTYVGFEELVMFKEMCKKYDLAMVILDRNGEIFDEFNLPPNLEATELMEQYF